MRSSTRRTSLLHMCCIICRLKIRSVGPGSWVSETTSACTRRVMLSRLTRLVSITFLTMSRPMYEMACRAQPHYCYDETVRCGAVRRGAARGGRGMTGVRRAWRLRCARRGPASAEALRGRGSRSSHRQPGGPNSCGCRTSPPPPPARSAHRSLGPCSRRSSQTGMRHCRRHSSSGPRRTRVRRPSLAPECGAASATSRD